MVIQGLLGEGKEIQLADLSTAGSGSQEIHFSIDAESVLLSLYVGSVVGDLDVVAYTVGIDGQDVEIISFPTISSPTNSILLRKAAATLQKIKVVITYTGAVDLNLRARGVSAGAASVRIEGANSFTVTQKDVTTTAAALLTAGLTDRNAILIVNVSAEGVIWVAETLAKATAAAGAPIYPSGGNLSIDLAAGAALYAVASAGTLDARIIETGAS